MLFKVESMVSKEFIDNTDLNDEFFFRELAKKIVSEIPMDDLKSLIKFTVVDPNTDESKKILRNKDIISNEKSTLNHLYMVGRVLYKAEILTKKP